ncbi:MAG: hypothetical protein U9P44_00830, partial [archaeon]|nr:hypothetical protein [archaeon]
SLPVHFCSASTKYDHQYCNRLKRRAGNIKAPWETVTRDGLIYKGVIFEELGTSKLVLPKKTFRQADKRIETSVKNAKKAAKKGLKAAVVLQMPTEDSFDFELTLLDKKGKKIE